MRVFGLIGQPLDHSWSADYFAKKFRMENISDAIYKNFPLEKLSDVMETIRVNDELTGLNVTMPYKSEIIGYLDELDEEARAIGAVNCISINRKGRKIRLKGFNTDSTAFKTTLEPLLNPEIDKSLVLGTGGAARAIAHALQKLGLDYKMVSRQNGKGDFTYDEVTEEMVAESKLIINATPVGMTGFDDSAPPIPLEMIGPRHILYDLIYNPPETLFLKRGKDSKARVLNGMAMLKVQADLSWDIWNKA